jgi:long-chain acyl-CoA synthetase
VATAAPDGLDTFPKWLAHHARERPARPAMRHKDLGIWREWTWSALHDAVRAYALGLTALGLGRGDRIAVIGANRPRLYWTMMAAQALGAIPVPVYADSVAEEMAYVLDHAGVSIAAVQDQEQVDKLIAVADRVPTLGHVLYDEPRGLRDYDHARLHPIAHVIQQGQDMLAAAADAASRYAAMVAAGTGDDVSIILYTSGTTGRSKGVVLTAGRCIAAARDSVAQDKLTDRDEVIAYLPMAWVGDHYLNYAQMMIAGFCVNCPESPETAVSDRREIGTTYAFAPPRVFEGMLTSITIRMEDASWLKRRIYAHFMAVAKAWGEKILNREPVPLAARLHYGLGEILVYGPLKNVLGLSTIRIGYTAGEAIGPELFAFFRSIGLNLKQLYGQTEAFLLITAQPDGEIRADTVGPVMPNVDLRISPDGEVLYRSPGMFQGYYKDPERTAETMTEDGFVRTGDAGFLDARGHLKIIDRIRDVGRLRSDALFAPKYIENKLKFFPNIKEAVAFGQARDFVTCFINIDMAAVGNWAERNNVAYASYQELAAHPDVYAIVRGHVEAVNRTLAAEPMMAAAQIRRFLILHKELDADDGEITRTQKVRRGFVAERYMALVRGLYDGATEADITTEVTFEDGRKGTLSARVRIEDVEAFAPASGAAA